MRLRTIGYTINGDRPSLTGSRGGNNQSIVVSVLFHHVRVAQTVQGQPIQELVGTYFCMVKAENILRKHMTWKPRKAFNAAAQRYQRLGELSHSVLYRVRELRRMYGLSNMSRTRGALR